MIAKDNSTEMLGSGGEKLFFVEDVHGQDCSACWFDTQDSDPGRCFTAPCNKIHRTDGRVGHFARERSAP